MSGRFSDGWTGSSWLCPGSLFVLTSHTPESYGQLYTLALLEQLRHECNQHRDTSAALYRRIAGLFVNWPIPTYMISHRISRSCNLRCGPSVIEQSNNPRDHIDQVDQRRADRPTRKVSVLVYPYIKFRSHQRWIDAFPQHSDYRLFVDVHRLDR
jgi:hypothetical protein